MTLLHSKTGSYGGLTREGRFILYRVECRLAAEFGTALAEWTTYCRQAGREADPDKVYEPFGVKPILDAWKLVANLEDGVRR